VSAGRVQRLALVAALCLVGCRDADSGAQPSAAGISGHVGPRTSQPSTSAISDSRLGPPTTASTTTGLVTPQGDPADHLGAFLDALASGDSDEAGRRAAGPIRFFAFVRTLLGQDASSRGTRSKYRYSERAFVVGVSGTDRQEFVGRAVLDGESTLGSGRTIATSEVFSDPVLVGGADGWHVGELGYQGKPVRQSPGGAEQRLSGGVTARLVGALSLAERTEVVVEFVADREVSLRISSARLVYDDGAVQPRARALIGRHLYASHQRRDGPVRWEARVSVDGEGALPVSLDFSS